MSLCYVTAFLDLEREKWIRFERSFSDYLKQFEKLLNMFNNFTKNFLIIFVDKKRFLEVKNLCEKQKYKSIKIIEIDREYLNKNSILWKRLEKEKEIMNSDFYKKIISNRKDFPENTIPEYTMINHIKIDFVNIASTMCNHEYFCWIDFGGKEIIPTNPLDINFFKDNKIHYTIINRIEENDNNVIYTLRNAPEKIGGFFFAGNRKAIKEYQILYHRIHLLFQECAIADDDQHIALQCYFTNPELFSLHYTGRWHYALKFFEEKTIRPSLTEIMNKHGSDKGSGHHNYTEYYSKIFEDIRDEKLNILEFGIGSINPSIPSNMSGTPIHPGKLKYSPGASLRGWKEYFPNAKIYGCDIDEKTLFEEERIKTFYLDQTNLETVKTEIANKDIIYDIIIDDGLHNFALNWCIMRMIFSKLSENGYYIIEDIVDFNTIVYKDGFLKNAEMRYFSIPNEQNKSDNNIVVLRKKGKRIIDL